MRSIVVDDVTYVWKRTHEHKQGCVEKLVVIVETSQEHGGARMSLRFREAGGWIPGDIDSGVLVHPRHQPVNLNLPSVVGAIIRRAHQAGWPISEKNIELDDPYDWLADILGGAVFVQIREARSCGVVHAGRSDSSILANVLAAFQLRADVELREIDRDAAERLLFRILSTDLAYDGDVMPEALARRLTQTVLSDSPADARFYTNGTFHLPPAVVDGRTTTVGSWNPATDATFDTGVVALSEAGSWCVWVEDED